MVKTKVIYTSFAGRRRNYEVQMHYIEKLVADGHIDEVHFWDYTREIEDSIWLKHAFGIRNPYVYRAPKNDYRRVPIKIIPHRFELRVRGANNAHILLVNSTDAYEIILGGWNNSKSVVKKNHEECCVFNNPILRKDKWSKITLQYNNSNANLSIIYNSNVILQVNVGDLNTYCNMNMMVSGYFGSSVDFDFSEFKNLLVIDALPQEGKYANNKKFKLMETANKFTWVDYYLHYTQTRYPNHIIIKADDDIVYIDVSGFPKFIENRLKATDAFLYFPSIINNGICAYYQQKHWKLIPESIGNFSYTTFQGLLWESAEICEKLHKYFTTNYKRIVKDSKKHKPILHTIGDRISINMFAILSKDLDLFSYLCNSLFNDPFELDDELHLTVTIPKIFNRYAIIDPCMTISHLSFYRQVEMGLPSTKILGDYMEITKYISRTDCSWTRKIFDLRNLFVVICFLIALKLPRNKKPIPKV